MKKLSALVSGLGYLILTTSAWAQDSVQLLRPTINSKNVGYTDIAEFINNVIRLIFIIAVILVLFMLVWGAVQWIFSGGDKEAVGKARDRIIHALVGLAILAVAFAIARIAGQFLGFDIFGVLPIPSPSGT